MILIMGGSTSVGQYCIQFCVLAGFKRILTTCSPKNNDLVKAAGATHVFDRDAEDLNEQIRKVTGDDLIYAVDSAAADDIQMQSYTALSDTKPGVCAILLHSVLPWRTRPKKPFGTRQTWKIDGFANVWTEISEEYFKVLPRWLESGEVKPMKHQYLPGGLAAVPKGCKMLMDNEISGSKLVVHPQESLP
jgi:NADPH:quinone reductase-like Zn-dependent oxidoreductase